MVDDIDTSITHIIRGGDHITNNTGVQIALFQALDGAVPIFAHHNLLTDASGEGFSKRTGSLSLRSFQAEGYEPGKRWRRCRQRRHLARRGKRWVRSSNWLPISTCRRVALGRPL